MNTKTITNRTRRALVSSALLITAAAWLQPNQAIAADKLQVAAIYTVPVEQQWVSRIHTALGAAQDRGEIDYVYSESVANPDYERVLREYAEDGKQFIIGEAFAVETAARKVAKDYPEISFLLGSSGKPQEPNFSTFDNYIHEPAYLTGMIAGGMSKSGKIGMVGGFPIPEVNRLMNAFMAGVLEINPQAEFMVSFINSWFDPPQAKEAAFAMIDKGADVMYAERFGVSDAARERKVLAIGNVVNTQENYPQTVVASALWDMAATVDTAIKAVQAGSFKAEDYGKYSTMKYNGSSLAPLGTFADIVPADLQSKVEARQKEILDGSFVVEIDDSRPEPAR